MSARTRVGIVGSIAAFLIAMIGTEARGYALIWGAMGPAWAEASAYASMIGPPFQFDLENHKAKWPTDPLPLSVHSIASVPWAGAWSTSALSTTALDLSVHAAAGDNPGCEASAFAAASFCRAFRIIGGIGSVDVSIPVRNIAHSWESAYFDWEYGVRGVSSIGGHILGESVDWDLLRPWSGRLEFGRTYYFGASAAAETADYDDGAFSLLFSGSNSAPFPLDQVRPVPEPAGWALFGLGVAIAVIFRKPIRFRDASNH